MAVETGQTNIPPFPDDVPTAKLACLSISKLIAGDTSESESLFQACTTTGFFLLDLRDHNLGQLLLEAVPPMFKLAKALFELESAEKDVYSFKEGQPIFGYKGHGVGKIDEKGTPDRCEFWSVSKDDILTVSESRPNPSIILDNQQDFEQFMKRSHEIVDLICMHLDKHLVLPPSTLSFRQRLLKPSGNQVRLIKTPPQPPNDQRTSLVPHTDIGTITVLFNLLGGLQILPPGGDASISTDWQFVRPAPGCAIINMGDAMVQWTHGALRSNMHRVSFPPGEQGKLTRYSVAYFARPESEAIMSPLKESELVRSLMLKSGVSESAEENSFKAKEWEHRKGMSLRSGLNKPKSAGGMPVIGSNATDV